MTSIQSKLLVLQAALAGLHVLNVGLVALGTYRMAALVVASLVAAGQFYVTHAANQTMPFGAFKPLGQRWRCGKCGALLQWRRE